MREGWQEVWIDYGHEKFESSIDLFLVNKDEKVIKIYQIKTDKDVPKGVSNFKEILKNLYEFQEYLKDEYEGYTIKSFFHCKDYEDSAQDSIIVMCTHIRELKIRKERSRVSPERVKELLHKYNWGIDGGVFCDFIDNVDVNSKFTYERDSQLGTDLDNEIKSQLENLIEEFNIGKHPQEVSVIGIKAELLLVIAENCEENKNVVPNIHQKTVEILIRLRIHEMLASKLREDNEKLRRLAKEEISTKYESIFNTTETKKINLNIENG
jgi:hypothetical protein